MNTCEYTSSLPPRRTPVRSTGRWPFAALQRIIDTAGLVSVDLTDAIFATPGNRDALAAKYTGEIATLPGRSNQRD